MYATVNISVATDTEWATFLRKVELMVGRSPSYFHKKIPQHILNWGALE